MGKPKAKTLQQKLGFFDDDLTSPDHDAIMKWLHKHIAKDLENCQSELEKIDEKIESLGSLFKQLRTYQKYETGDIIVVCPDDSNREIIEDQGFKFYKFK